MVLSSITGFIVWCFISILIIMQSLVGMNKNEIQTIEFIGSGFEWQIYVRVLKCRNNWYILISFVIDLDLDSTYLKYNKPSRLCIPTCSLYILYNNYNITIYLNCHLLLSGSLNSNSGKVTIRFPQFLVWPYVHTKFKQKYEA